MRQQTTLAGLTRREVIRRALVSSGLALAATNTTLLTACASTGSRSARAVFTPFSDEEIAWLDEVAETILPETETPGAKAAEVGAFIALMVADTYSPEEQVHFRSGVQSLEAECTSSHGVGFRSASQAQRVEILERLDRAQWERAKKKAEEQTEKQIEKSTEEQADELPHYFRMIKQLTVLGYFTSEIGYTEAMRYAETPGRYDPCVPYVEGDVSWARHA